MGCDLNVKSLKTNQEEKKLKKFKYKTVINIQICVLYSSFVSVWLVSKKKKNIKMKKVWCRNQI